MEQGLSTREAARIALIRTTIREPESLTGAFLSAARLSARTLKVARVGIWSFVREGSAIQCDYLHDPSRDDAGENELIELTSCPRYAAALQAHRVIAADDALSDPRTCELRGYLEARGIGAVLDSPIFEKGVPVGIICHEHVGGPREWSKEEANFAASVSDMLGLYLEQDATQRHHRSLMAARSELEQARVMETVGRMAAGVAHDFNNVLSALGMCSELLRLQKAPTRELVAASVDETQALIEQGARLVRQLLDVARQRPSDEVVDLVAVVQNLTAFLHTLEPDGIHFELKLFTQNAMVRVGRSRLEQVLMNLAVNARDAMLGGGTLTIEVAHREPEEGQPPRVRLSVRDTGVGMDEHTRERMFEPYFTTKGEGAGMGLGLATVYRIVQDAGGRIQVHTAPGAGTEFTIDWPLA